MKVVNRNLDHVYLPKYWQIDNTVQPRDEVSRYRPLKQHENLDEIFCIKPTRQVRSDHTVHFENQLYKVTDCQYGSKTPPHALFYSLRIAAAGNRGPGYHSAIARSSPVITTNDDDVASHPHG